MPIALHLHASLHAHSVSDLWPRLGATPAAAPLHCRHAIHGCARAARLSLQQTCGGLRGHQPSWRRHACTPHLLFSTGETKVTVQREQHNV